MFLVCLLFFNGETDPDDTTHNAYRDAVCTVQDRRRRDNYAAMAQPPAQGDQGDGGGKSAGGAAAGGGTGGAGGAAGVGGAEGAGGGVLGAAVAASAISVPFSLPFEKLFKSLGAALTEDGPGSLAVYSLIYGNPTFREFVLARDDLDDLMMPLLEKLYCVSDLPAHRIYMLLIITLMFTQVRRMFIGFILPSGLFNRFICCSCSHT